MSLMCQVSCRARIAVPARTSFLASLRDFLRASEIVVGMRPACKDRCLLGRPLQYIATLLSGLLAPACVIYYYIQALRTTRLPAAIVINMIGASLVLVTVLLDLEDLIGAGTLLLG